MTGSARGVAPPAKAPTRTTGSDDVTRGGLPRGRPTLVAGSAGAGTTLFGIELLVPGALDQGEPGSCRALRDHESSDERDRRVLVIESRGTAHADQVRGLEQVEASDAHARAGGRPVQAQHRTRGAGR